VGFSLGAKHKSLFIWLVFWVLSLGLHAQADRFVFFGKVLDGETGEGLPGATLQKGKEVLGLCTPTGDFRFELEQAETEVLVRYVGYTPMEVRLRVSDTGTEIRLRPAATALNAVVVTGSRYGKRAAEETVSIEVVSRELIKNTSAVETAEILNRVPGVQVSDGQANIRGGSGYAYGVGSRVSVLLGI
jgi:sulfur carrier protein ThiS